MFGRLLFPLTLIIGLNINAHAQWTPLTSGTTHNLRSVYFVTPATGWVVGDSGTILKTSNAGSTWSAQSSGTRNNLRAIRFTDVNTGWVVGDSGTRLKTINGGSSWSAQPIQQNKISLTSIDFLNTNTGWVVGFGIDSTNTYTPPTILKTTNGGNTWNLQSSFKSGAGLTSVNFIDTNTGCAVGSVVLNTTNGGSIWNEIFGMGVGGILNSVHSIKPDLVWAVGGLTTGSGRFFTSSGVIMKSSNGGITWTSQSSGTTNYLYSVKFMDANTGWTVGEGGIILKTTDGGTTWYPLNSTVTSSLLSIYPVDVNIVYTVGTNGIILKSVNGGGGAPIFGIKKSHSNLILQRDQILWYNIATPSPIQILLFDSRGRTTLKLMDGVQALGEHVVDLSSLNLAHGSYFLDFKADGVRKAMRIEKK